MSINQISQGLPGTKWLYSIGFSRKLHHVKMGYSDWTVSHHTESSTMPDLLHFSLTSVLWHYVFWSASPSFFLFLTQPPSPSLSLINSTGLPSDAFQARPSFHRLGRSRRPEGYWLNRLKLGEKTELSLLKIKTLLSLRIVDRSV